MVGIFDSPPLPPIETPEPLGIVLFSGDFARAHYALAMAAAAAAIGRPVVLFATHGGCRAFLKAGADGRPGWAELDDALERDAALRGRGVAGFAELLAAIAEMGVRLIVCEAGLRAMDLEPGDLDPHLEGEVAGLVTFFEQMRGGQTLFV